MKRLSCRIDIIKTYKLTEGQGHMVNGKGKTRNNEKGLLCIYIMNRRLDLDDTSI